MTFVSKLFVVSTFSSLTDDNRPFIVRESFPLIPFSLKTPSPRRLIPPFMTTEPSTSKHFVIKVPAISTKFSFTLANSAVKSEIRVSPKIRSPGAYTLHFSDRKESNTTGISFDKISVFSVTAFEDRKKVVPSQRPIE